MNTIQISDMTMKQGGLSLSFQEKIELSKLLDKLGASVIELEAIQREKIDSLLIKSIASAVGGSILAVPVALSSANIAATWNALKGAKHPRLQVVAPVSPVQMEYLSHKKPDKMLSAIEETIRDCKALCEDVEFIADDATRSDPAFLYSALNTALTAGATTITLCDAAGAMLSDEFAAFLQEVQANVPTLASTRLGVWCNNSLSMADACAIAAIKAGAGEIKTAAYSLCAPSLPCIAKVLSAKGSDLGASCTIQMAQMQRIADQISRICQGNKASVTNPVLNAAEVLILTAQDDAETVARAAARLGYELSDEDIISVYAAFSRIAAKKDEVSARELDAIVAAAAMQVPPTYILQNYVITAASAASATAHMKLMRGDKVLEGVSLGDGAIDAAFHALEQITGHHFELDDFQIQAVTEGREAMGQTVVKLRSQDKVYSGKGISTDIVGASIHAYLNALNKIVYEEAQV